MKKVLIALTTVLLFKSLTAVSLPLQKSDHGYSVLTEKSNSLELGYQIASINLEKVKTEKGDFTNISIPEGYLTDEVGKPALPSFHNLIEIPCGSTAQIEVVGYDEKEFDLKSAGYTNPLMPAQPSYSKSVKKEDVYLRYDAASYQKDSYIQKPVAELLSGGTIRGTGIATVKVYPFRYNPVKNKLVVLNNIKLKINFSGNLAKAADLKKKSYSPYFESSFKGVINYKEPSKTEYTDLERYPVTYLIVASDALQNNAKLNEFIKWKTQKGFKVVTNFVASTALPSAIDSWIETQYNTLTPKPSFVLLVGDESGSYAVQSEINPSLGTYGGVTRSDLRYGVIGDLTSTNHLPSMYVGRFSVRSLAELDAQVDKTIYYEKTQFTNNADLSYLANAMGVAGADAAHQTIHGNPHIRYAMTYYLNNTYTNPVTGTTNGINGIAHYDGASGQESNIVNTVSNGVAFYNYTAHGSETCFGTPYFSIGYIDNLTNTNKYGLVIGNCCLTGSFGTTECFGEAWLNAPNKGAIGYIGSAMSTQWNEDLAMGIGSTAAGQVQSGDITPDFTPDSPGMYDGLMLMKFPTQAGVKHVGLLAVETYGGNMRDSYWSAYHLFGDPSLMPFMGVPKNMTVTHAESLEPGSTSFTVQAVKNAFVALSDDNGVLHGAAMTDANGVANVILTVPYTAGYAQLVVYSQFKKTVIRSIPITGTITPNPAVTITSPAADTKITIGNSVTVTASASETGKSITKVDFYIDGVFKSTDSAAPYEFIWSTTGMSIGQHEIRTVAASSYDKVAEAKINVNLDIPSVTSVSEGFEGTFPPAGWTANNSWRQSGSCYNGTKSAAANYLPVAVSTLVSPPVLVSGSSTLEFYWKNTDPSKVSGHDSTICEITRNSGSSWTRLGVLSPSAAQSNYVLFSKDISSYTGDVKIRWRYKTNGSSTALGVSLDDVKILTNISAGPIPAVTITAPLANSSVAQGDIMLISASATETAKAISKVEFFVDNVLKSSLTSAPYQYNWTTSDAVVGSHTIKVVATNSTGKTAEAQVLVNVTAPVIGVTSITEGFEGTTFPPTGWSATTGWYQSLTCNSGSRSAASKYQPANTCNLTTPGIKVAGTSSVEFYWKNNDPSKIAGHDTTYCEISQNGTNWTILGFLSPTGSQSAYAKFTKDISAYPGNQVKIRWRYKTNGSSSAYGVSVDDIKVTTGTVVSTVLTTKITSPAEGASFTKGSLITIKGEVTETAKLATRADNKAVYTLNFYADNVLLGSDNTSPYEFVWNTASSTVGSHVIKTVATTSASTQTATAQVTVSLTGGSILYPISEGFEGTTFPPTGWTMSSTSAWSKGSEANTGTKCARALYTPAGTKTLNAPTVSIATGAQATLDFYWKNDDINAKVAKHDTTFCEISTNGTTWNRLAMLSPATSQTAYTKVSVNLSAYTGSSVKIRWRYKTNANSAAYGIGLDDVKLTVNSAKEFVEPITESAELVKVYPNPFNPTTTISLNLKNSGLINLSVYNVKGEMIRSLLKGYKEAGIHQVTFDGAALNSGTYFYKLEADGKTVINKMILVK